MIPEYFIEAITTLQKQLYEILPEGAGPAKPGTIIEPVSKIEDIALVQHYYNLTTFLLTKTFPEIEEKKYSSFTDMGLIAYLAGQLTPGFSTTLRDYIQPIQSFTKPGNLFLGPYSYYAASAIYGALSPLLEDQKLPLEMQKFLTDINTLVPKIPGLRGEGFTVRKFTEEKVLTEFGRLFSESHNADVLNGASFGTPQNPLTLYTAAHN